MKNTERFSNRVDNYVLYRPHYPDAIIPFLTERIELNPQWVVADIGSGTGISSELFLKNGNRVFGVEPNKEMRQAAEKLFLNEKNFISINATAEDTSLEDHCIDLILAGQAFHWFDLQKTKSEFQRIGKKDSYIALLWNDRKENSKFQQLYNEMLKMYAPTYKGVCERNVNVKAIKQFFLPHHCHVKEFPNSQSFDFQGLVGRLLSCSYAPLEGEPTYNSIMTRLREIFDQCNVNGKVIFEYTCKIYYGKTE